jgi:hypothetical protein
MPEPYVFSDCLLPTDKPKVGEPEEKRSYLSIETTLYQFFV